MTEKEKVERYTLFRKLCLVNSEQALNSAKLLATQGANHIAFHLLVLSLEEVGKIFVGYALLTRQEKWGERNVNFGFDDHVKKLFWAIWGPTFGLKKITRQDWDENRRTASQLHEKRLDALYTDLDDQICGKDKVSAEDLTALISYVEGRLELGKVEGEKAIEDVSNPDQDWLSIQLSNPERRPFIFSEQSQHKLIDFDGEVALWINWLKEYYEKEELYLASLGEEELARKIHPGTQQITPKWKLRIKVISPSHDIRQNVLEAFNKRNPFVKLYTADDNHTLNIDFIIGDHISWQSLWHYGWSLSKLFVASLNISSNGFFYWNAITDKETFYESIHDLQSNKRLKVYPPSGLLINWEKASMRLNESHIDTADFLFRYLLRLQDQIILQAIGYYCSAVALIAKSDVHSRFEIIIFSDLFAAFKVSVCHALQLNSLDTLVEVAYDQLTGMVVNKQEFYRIISMGIDMENKVSFKNPITLSDILLLKQYCGMFFLTLAAREASGDATTRLTYE